MWAHRGEHAVVLEDAEVRRSSGLPPGDVNIGETDGERIRADIGAGIGGAPGGKWPAPPVPVDERTNAERQVELTVVQTRKTGPPRLAPSERITRGQLTAFYAEHDPGKAHLVGMFLSKHPPAKIIQVLRDRYHDDPSTFPANDVKGAEEL